MSAGLHCFQSADVRVNTPPALSASREARQPWERQLDNKKKPYCPGSERIIEVTAEGPAFLWLPPQIPTLTTYAGAAHDDNTARLVQRVDNAGEVAQRLTVRHLGLCGGEDVKCSDGVARKSEVEGKKMVGSRNLFTPSIWKNFTEGDAEQPVGGNVPQHRVGQRAVAQGAHVHAEALQSRQGRGLGGEGGAKVVQPAENVA